MKITLMASPSSPQVTISTFVVISLHASSSFPTHIVDAPLAKTLKSPLPIFAATTLEKFTSISEITSLSLAYSNVVTLPESPCNALSSSITLSGESQLFPLIVSLRNLVDLDLSGNGNLDFGALSQWLNQSSVISLDLSYIPQWRDEPNKVALLMKSAKKLKHLRFDYFLLSVVYF